MPRDDLLALTVDDLVLLANRGLVRRAQAELEADALELELDEDVGGTLTLRWSDGVTCTLPADEPLSDSRCSCPATTLCRHLLRSVLAYQQRAAAAAETTAAQPPAMWDPGAIDDQQLEQHVPRARLAAARKLFEAGQLIELARSRRPTARFHSLGGMLRFLVPGDVRYTHCECSAPAPCSHVPLAVWAFRLLDAGAAGGLVTTSSAPLAVPKALLDEVEAALRELLSAGLANAAQALLDRLRRLEADCRNHGLTWPGDILAELVQQAEAYSAHDARFDPERVVELLGEWCIRSDAIRAGTGAIPQLFVRGTPSDTAIAVGSARLIGLGCDVRIRRGGVELTALLHDSSSGTLVTLGRAFADPPDVAPEQRRPFAQLAQATPLRGSSFAAIGAGQLLAKGGKRTPSGAFIPGRSAFSLSPQAYAWESLRAPLLVEDFAEQAARDAAALPLALRPRRAGEDVIVCPVAGAQSVRFNAPRQALEAVLRDHHGNTATLVHPYTTRGQAGFEALSGLLHSRADTVAFVCAHTRRGAGGLLLAPISLVFDDAGSRTLCQPWIDGLRSGEQAAPASGGTSGLPARDPIADYLRQSVTALSELCLLGLHSADEPMLRAWTELLQRGGAVGFARATDPVQRLVDALAARPHALQWADRPAADAALELAVLTVLMSEMQRGEL